MGLLRVALQVKEDVYPVYKCSSQLRTRGRISTFIPELCVYRVWVTISICSLKMCDRSGQLPVSLAISL